MKDLLDEVNVYIFNNAYLIKAIDYLDTERDVTTPYGVLTWRRRGQDVPEGMTPIFHFKPSDAQERNVGEFADALQRATHHTMKVSEIIAAVEKVQRDVRAAIPTGKGWGYVHSQKYHDRVASNKALEERIAAGEIMQWENELLNHNESASA